MTELEASVGGEHPPPYIIFVVVFLFFLTGLLGFLICHLLKKKGYHCRTGDMDDEEEEEEEKLGGNADDADEENQDTVEQILKCIIENEANMEAFNEMIGNRNVCVRHDPRLRKESIGGVPAHLHTVHSGTDHNSCHLCAQVRSKKGRRQSRTPRFKQRPGEQTVFSVGRFRVTHTDKKLHGGPNPLVSSGDQLDQSQDSEERKEGVYNLRSMFKDVRAPEGSNGVAPIVGKRRKSLTLFGLRRSSDPVGIKVGEGPGRAAGGVRFTLQQQPVVLEELLQAKSPEVVDPDHGSRPGVKPGPGKPPSSRSQDLAQGAESALEDGSKHGPGPETATNTTAISPPSSLPVPSPASSGQTFKSTDKQGPVQTSTPISPMPGSIPSSTPTGPPEPCPGAGFPVSQSSSPDLESGFGGSPVLVSLGSSPPSLPSSQTVAVPTSPKLSSEAANRTCSPALTPSPKLPSGQATSSQSPTPTSSSPSNPPQTPSSSRPLSLKSGGVMSGTSLIKEDMISSPSPTKEQQQEASRTPKTEIKRVGILKTAKPSPNPEGTALYPPADQLSKNQPSSLPPSSSSLLSASSPVGSRAGSVTIISPDSKRQFAVATMVEEEEPSTVMRDQKEATSEPEQAGISPTLGQGGQVSVLDVGEPPGAEIKPRVRSQEKDDMVEMEDIRDCKVTEEEGDI